MGRIWRRENRAGSFIPYRCGITPTPNDGFCPIFQALPPGLKTIAGRLITATGVKPLGLSQWQRDNFYLYGVVELLSGYSFFYEFSHLDSDCFQRFLELLCAEIGDDVAVIQFDRGAAAATGAGFQNLGGVGGSFHRAEALDWPENIIPIFQPSHSPYLATIERF